MSEHVEPPSWVNLLTLLVHGPTPPVRGLIRTIVGDDDSVGWFAWGGEPPVLAGLRSARTPEAADPAGPIRVWWDGTRLRVEELDGAINVVANADLCWQWEEGHAEPFVAPRAELRLIPGGVELLERWTADHFLGDDFTRPAGPVGMTHCLGRLAWTVELAPPGHKPHPMQLVVDAETGMLLQKRNDAFGIVSEWVEFEVVDRHDDALFHWTGPVRERRSWREESLAEHERDMAARRDWFRTNVGALPVPVEFAADVVVHHHGDDGSFEASVDHVGGLAGRPRSDAPWELGWAAVDHRWSTERWDFALQCHEGRLTDRGLENLKAHLRDLP